MRDGLASDAVQALVEDREGNIWLGTPGGLQRLSPQRVTPRRDLGVARVLEATPDGTCGWARLRVSRDSPARRPGRSPRADGLPGSVVLALHKGVNGDLWVATERGVATYANGRFVPLRLPADAHLPRIFAHRHDGEDVWLRDFYFRLLPLARRAPAAGGRHPRPLPQEPAVDARGPARAGSGWAARAASWACARPTGPSPRGSCRSAASSALHADMDGTSGPAATRA